MKTIYLSSAYLAPVEYYAKLVAYDKIFIEQHDHYVKQTYRNRCTIAAPDGELALSSCYRMYPSVYNKRIEEYRIPRTGM